ncbi:Argininosuccinate lyase (plasmid) [Variovorax sp. SRS16]|uniref:Bug family tripartite tricarboxylate transporter substrate binding protein n=1 Tax=Variovorax sp. SRS16 TaxID=282217 RepID=UPI001319445F|nr:tripartite tricarboxylate transporter substrate binding protein [Variovorax sp. SRS16]VTU45953.1 Argininosuccinate lyase [Variovorax sp. SRS16]
MNIDRKPIGQTAAWRVNRRAFLTGTGAAGLCLSGVGIVSSAVAEEKPWQPTRPIRLIVPYPPGGGIDIVGRFIAPKLQDGLDQTVIVENKPGAVGMIGSEYVYRSPPDGYTYVVASADTHSINPHVYTGLRYKASEFSPAAAIARLDYMFVARPDLPVSTIKDVIELARRQELTYASSGVGSSAQVVTEALKARYKLKLLHVPYAGSGPAAGAIMGSQVDLLMVPIAIALASRAKMKILGVASATRFAGAPDIPSLAEQGYPIGLDAAWIGLMGPPHTPRPALERIHGIVDRIVREPGTRERLLALGLMPYTATLDEFSSQTKAAYQSWGEVVAAAGIHADSTQLN